MKIEDRLFVPSKDNKLKSLDVNSNGVLYIRHGNALMAYGIK